MSTERSVAFQIKDRMNLVYRVVRAILRVLLKLWFSPQVQQAEAVPSEGPAIIAPVHRSNLDFTFSVLLTNRKLYFIAKDSLFKGKLLTWFFLTMGAFPVHRGSADREALQRCEAVLEAGHLLVLFPEGTRRSGPQLEDLLEGAAFLSLRSGAPIIPVGIGGSEAAMPKGSKAIKRVPVNVVQGEAVLPPPMPGEGRRPRSAVRELNAELTDALAQAFAKARELNEQR